MEEDCTRRERCVQRPCGGEGHVSLKSWNRSVWRELGDQSGTWWGQEMTLVRQGFQKGHRLYGEGPPTHRLTSGFWNQRLWAGPEDENRSEGSTGDVANYCWVSPASKVLREKKQFHHAVLSGEGFFLKIYINKMLRKNLHMWPKKKKYVLMRSNTNSHHTQSPSPSWAALCQYIHPRFYHKFYQCVCVCVSPSVVSNSLQPHGL